MSLYFISIYTWVNHERTPGREWDGFLANKELQCPQVVLFLDGFHAPVLVKVPQNSQLKSVCLVWTLSSSFWGGGRASFLSFQKPVSTDETAETVAGHPELSGHPRNKQMSEWRNAKALLAFHSGWKSTHLLKSCTLIGLCGTCTSHFMLHVSWAPPLFRREIIISTPHYSFKILTTSNMTYYSRIRHITVYKVLAVSSTFASLVSRHWMIIEI